MNHPHPWLDPDTWSWIFFVLIWSGGYIRGRNAKAGEWYAICNQPAFILGAYDLGMSGSLATTGLIIWNATLSLWRMRQRRRGLPATVPAAARTWWTSRRGATVYTLPTPAHPAEEAA